MKKETLEKIRNFLEYLFVLFMSILIMLITFGSLHVHAGFVDSIPDNYNAVNMSAYNSFCLNDGESSSKYPDYPYNIYENITIIPTPSLNMIARLSAPIILLSPLLSLKNDII